MSNNRRNINGRYFQFFLNFFRLLNKIILGCLIIKLSTSVNNSYKDVCKRVLTSMLFYIILILHSVLFFQLILALGKPMHERNFPRSFWHPEAKLLSQQVHIEHAQTLPAQQYQRANPRTVFNHVPRTNNEFNFGNRLHPPQCLQTSSYSDFSVQRSNLISNFGCIRMPRPYFTNDTLTCHAEPRADVITGATRIYGPRIGYGFNPRYNSLLIQPEVNPQLPRIPGEPRSS